LGDPGVASRTSGGWDLVRRVAPGLGSVGPAGKTYRGAGLLQHWRRPFRGADYRRNPGDADQPVERSGGRAANPMGGARKRGAPAQRGGCRNR
jgi:hypothetical protein